MMSMKSPKPKPSFSHSENGSPFFAGASAAAVAVATLALLALVHAGGYLRKSRLALCLGVLRSDPAGHAVKLARITPDVAWSEYVICDTIDIHTQRLCASEFCVVLASLLRMRRSSTRRLAPRPVRFSLGTRGR